jgi:hypothetical protein
MRVGLQRVAHLSYFFVVSTQKTACSPNPLLWVFLTEHCTHHGRSDPLLLSLRLCSFCPDISKTDVDAGLHSTDVFGSYNYDAIPSLDHQHDNYQNEHGLHESHGSYHNITQEDCWQVISAFFNERNLVSQQISSFDGFVNTTMQELVDETGSLVLEQSMQYTDKAGDMTVS